MWREWSFRWLDQILCSSVNCFISRWVKVNVIKMWQKNSHIRKKNTMLLRLTMSSKIVGSEDIFSYSSICKSFSWDNLHCSRKKRMTFPTSAYCTMCDFHNFGLIFVGQMHCLPQRLKSTFLEIFSSLRWLYLKKFQKTLILAYWGKQCILSHENETKIVKIRHSGMVSLNRN